MIATTARIITGILVLIGFGGFTFFMVVSRAEGEPQWSHLVYVYGGIEAIAFAAAGFLWGREVNRQRAETAEQTATLATHQAQQAQVRAAQQEQRGRAVAALVAQKVGSAAAKAATFGSLGLAAVHTATQADLQEIDEFARTMFP
jgi:hypothetical protein